MSVPARGRFIRLTVILSLLTALAVPSVAAEPELEVQAIDTSDRNAVAASFQSEFLGPMNAHGQSVGWTGNLASCSPGTISPAFSAMTLSHINWFRQMVGSPKVSFDPALSDQSQAAALVMAANESLSHYPPNDWECWSSTAYTGAGNSNISLAFDWSFGVFIGDQTASYMMDAGDNNREVGHRNWILLPAVRPFGFGAVYTDLVAATAMWVTGSGPDTNDFVMWPAEGYVPDRVIFPRWNLAYDGDADFSSATVSMSTNGQPIPVEVISRTGSAGMNQIVWELGEENSPLPERAGVPGCEVVSIMCSTYIPATNGDIPVDVTVSNILIDGVPTTHTYRVTIFSPGTSGTPSHEGTFTDDDDSVFVSDIEWLAASGITRGCNPPANDRFCPDASVTRGQMAAFLKRALNLASAPNHFTDDNGHGFEADIAALAAAGITRGCNPPANTRFCPDDPVTRGQMAAFLRRALEN